MTCIIYMYMALHDNYKQYKSNCVKKCHAIFGPGQ